MSENKIFIESFKIDLHLNATISINGDAWAKPGCSVSTTWKNGLPEPEQISLALEYMGKEILEPTLNDVVAMVTENIKKARGLEES